MGVLIAGLLMFIGVHSIGLFGLRERGIASIGEGPFKGLYSLLAAAGLLAITYGYSLARLSPTILWIPPLWARHLVLLLMLPVFPLLFAAYLPGRIRALTRHPMLLGTTLWSAAHLLANGMLADLLLFGAFLAWSILARLSLDRRSVPRPIAAAPEGRYNDLIAVLGGLSLYGVTAVWLHLWLIGVPPLVW